MAQARTGIKNPPELHEAIEYVAWKKEIEIWKIVCKYDKKEMAPAVTLSLKGSAREAAREMSIADLNADDGLDKLITKLDGLYLKDEKQRKYVAIKSFEKFTRSSSQTLDDYINEFERYYNKIKTHGVNLPDDFVAYRLLESANLKQSKSELVRTTLNNLAYNDMKTQLRKLEDVVIQDNGEPFVKSEPEDTLYGTHRDSGAAYHNSRSRVTFMRGGGASQFRGTSRSRGSSRGRGRGNASRGGFRGRNNFARRGRGNCYRCNSSEHYIDQCPVSNEESYTGYGEEGFQEVLQGEDVEEIALTW